MGKFHLPPRMWLCFITIICFRHEAKTELPSKGEGGIKLAGVESTWHFSISFPRCHIINKLNKLLLTALANLKSYLVDLFPVYPVLQSCWETTMWHCQPLIPRPDIVCRSAKTFPELVCRDAESHWKLLAACIHCWRQQVSQVTFSCPTSQDHPKMETTKVKK